jgi:hypothetical protein
MKYNQIEVEDSKINGIDFGDEKKARQAASALTSGIFEGLVVDQQIIILFRDYANHLITIVQLVEKIKEKSYV